MSRLAVTVLVVLAVYVAVFFVWPDGTSHNPDVRARWQFRQITLVVAPILFLVAAFLARRRRQTKR